MSAHVLVLALSSILGLSLGYSQQLRTVHNQRPNVVGDKASKPVDCDPNRYTVEEDPDTNAVKVVSGGTVLHTIKLLSDAERNGFAFNGVNQTKQGFEISIEYGSVIYYGKTFIFICTQHKFYLSKIRVESFNRHDPEKWSRKVIKVKPKLRLEKFQLTDFMQEGIIK